MTSILIVDDQPPFRRALRLALEAAGYKIREAANGADAMKMVRTDSPDLVLLDWLMPDVDGIQLCRSIRSTSDAPIIMVTSRKDGRSLALAAGADDYLTKPFDFRDLRLRIEFALSR
jgi:DNA-binding response OmpR family regulator